MILPGTPAWRRRAALAILALGAVLFGRTISKELPREQTLVFRLGSGARHLPLKLSASVTRVGESEARVGLTLIRDGTERSDPQQTLRLPDGDYVVTVEWAVRADTAGGAEGKEGETTRVERVTLAGGESIVPLEKRVRE
jgi:hypothetical protein